jgi:hypothetical protein
MSKLSEHPVIVTVGFLAAVAGILTFVHEVWTPGQKPTAATVPPSASSSPAPQQPFDAEWWFVDADGAKPRLRSFFVDRNSIKDEGGVRKAWSYILLESPEIDNSVSMKALVEYDCKGNRSRGTSFVRRYVNGTTDDISYPQAKFVSQAPDTVGQRLLNFVCFDVRVRAMRLSDDDPKAAMARLVARH